MKITLTESEYVDRLLADSNARWSIGGAEAVVRYLMELEDDTGEEIEFDVVGIRCEFTEYSSALEAAEEYGYERDSDSEDAEELEEKALEWLQSQTTVLTLHSGGVVILDF